MRPSPDVKQTLGLTVPSDNILDFLRRNINGALAIPWSLARVHASPIKPHIARQRWRWCLCLVRMASLVR